MDVHGWVDWALLAVLAVSTLVGVMRGFVFEFMSLAGWVVAWFAAQWATPSAAPHMPVGAPGSALQIGVTFAAVFVTALVCWTLLARLVRLLVHATPLSLPDRLLGAGFGLVRGGMLLVALATLIAFTPASRSRDWQESTGAAWLRAALQGLRPLLPPSMSGRIGSLLEP